MIEARTHVFLGDGTLRLGQLAAKLTSGEVVPAIMFQNDDTTVEPGKLDVPVPLNKQEHVALVFKSEAGFKVLEDLLAEVRSAWYGEVGHATAGYMVRHKPTGRMMGSGIRDNGRPKVWPKVGYARNAISQRYKSPSVRANYEVVPVNFTFGEVLP